LDVSSSASSSSVPAPTEPPVIPPPPETCAGIIVPPFFLSNLSDPETLVQCVERDSRLIVENPTLVIPDGSELRIEPGLEVSVYSLNFTVNDDADVVFNVNSSGSAGQLTVQRIYSETPDPNACYVPAGGFVLDFSQFNTANNTIANFSMEHGSGFTMVGLIQYECLNDDSVEFTTVRVENLDVDECSTSVSTEVAHDSEKRSIGVSVLFAEAEPGACDSDEVTDGGDGDESSLILEIWMMAVIGVALVVVIAVVVVGGAALAVFAARSRIRRKRLFAKIQSGMTNTAEAI